MNVQLPKKILFLKDITHRCKAGKAILPNSPPKFHKCPTSEDSSQRKKCSLHAQTSTVFCNKDKRACDSSSAMPTRKQCWALKTCRESSWLKQSDLIRAQCIAPFPGNEQCRNHLCWLLFWYPFHPCVTAGAHKSSRSFCQKCRWQVTAKHIYTLVMRSQMTITTKICVHTRREHCALYSNNGKMYHTMKITQAEDNPEGTFFQNRHNNLFHYKIKIQWKLYELNNKLVAYTHELIYIHV